MYMCICNQDCNRVHFRVSPHAVITMRELYATVAMGLGTNAILLHTYTYYTRSTRTYTYNYNWLCLFPVCAETNEEFVTCAL